MKGSLKPLHRSLLALMLTGVLAATAWALGLDEAKAKGWVGEQRDGYVGLVVPDAPAEARALVERVNAERQKSYAGIAAQRGTTPTKVAALAGLKLIERAAPGSYVQSESGAWVVK